jgi:hypothetical protein
MHMASTGTGQPPAAAPPPTAPSLPGQIHVSIVGNRDRLLIFVTALPGLAAVIALVFTWLSVNTTNYQLSISEQSQITDRYNAAITNLGSSSVDVRLGGIYALQRIMHDSPRDQATVVAVLCAFVRDHADAYTLKKAPNRPTTDIQAALTVVGTRDIAHDGSATVIDLTNTQLTGADLDGLELARAEFTGVDLTDATLIGVHLTDAQLNDAHLGGANLTGAHLDRANLKDAYLGSANLTGAYLVKADLTHTDLVNANFTHANHAGAHLADAIRRGTKGL